MSNLGDVVFCCDCDRNAEAQRSADGTESGSPPRRMAVKIDANGDRLCMICLDLRRASRNAAFLLRAGRGPIHQQPVEPGSTQIAEPPGRPPFLRVASAVRITRPPIGEPAPTAEPKRQARAQRVSRKAAFDLRLPAKAKAKTKTKAKTKAKGAIVGAKRIQASSGHVSVTGSRAAAARTATNRTTGRALAGPMNRKSKAAGRSLERAFLQLTAEIGILRARVLLELAKKKLLGS